MLNFTFHNPTQIFFGEDQIAAIAKEIPADAKILVTYGGGSIKSNGVYEQVSTALKDHNWIEFSGIEPNPQFDTLMKAVDVVKAEGITYLLAVGGGSVVDGTKFIAAAARFEGDEPWDILAKQAQVKDAVPLSCVLTLPATGSESNIGAVVTRDTTKLAFMSPFVRPVFAVLDPKVTLSLSERQVANGVVDAFVHTMEQYLTFPVNAKVQDRFSEGLLMNLIEEGPKVLANPDDLEVRSNIMWSATMALNGLIGSGVPQDWSTHMIGHELTGQYGIDHARTLAIILPAVMKVQREQKRGKLVQYAQRVWNIVDGTEDEVIDQAIEKTEAFFKAMGMPVRLTDAELDAESIENILAQLELHGMTSLGEHGDMTPEVNRKVLEAAL
ncbi:NADH-dependent alcohol dehydrogenase [Photobacterium profundum]|uniref:Putative iron-containing alcohol dehydrogenase n=1 Tax=Photobacterium profundum 3TCK TaxID=314280 RepID=Q1Z243_9GAMM|nr:iron-containing alcohol dehydrogenase [Photobacterium profundum]EAS42642.1 putative iron-containing alcohol dehydrogenase [Photobacterium profundum 3TCK]PSV59246.1 NADH-dependent alcohol dehydrogenase [Photobacterium profundum]